MLLYYIFKFILILLIYEKKDREHNKNSLDSLRWNNKKYMNFPTNLHTNITNRQTNSYTKVYLLEDLKKKAIR